jgi:hypothetical protein
MYFRLLIFFCTISLSASAQWWHIGSKKHEVLPLLQPAKDSSISRLSLNSKFSSATVQPLNLSQSRSSLEKAEASLMKIARHNMRFRIYDKASYNFSDLAELYIQLHRFSEAKWYLLQSNYLSRQQNDNKHTISNLISLAIIKIDIGDLALARTDLLEARNIARVKGMKAEAAEIEMKIQLLAQNRIITAKPATKYAENPEGAKKVF